MTYIDGIIKTSFCVGFIQGYSDGILSDVLEGDVTVENGIERLKHVGERLEKRLSEKYPEDK